MSFIEEMSAVESPDVDRATLATQNSFPQGESVVPFDLADLDSPLCRVSIFEYQYSCAAHRPSETVK